MMKNIKVRNVIPLVWYEVNTNVIDLKKEVIELLNDIKKLDARIESAKLFYNKYINESNTMVRKFPSNIIAKIHRIVKNGTVEEYDDLDPSYDKETATYVKLNGDSIECDSEGVSFAKSTVTIKQEGVYVFSGELNGKIVVDLDKDTKVRIILNNVSITSNDGPAIYGNASDKIIITLDENSTNTLVDSSKYSNEEEWKGTISSNDDITINGSGKLNITGNFKNGIQSNKCNGCK